jgi:hypothetical protein
MKPTTLPLLLLLLIPAVAHAQSDGTIRIVTWNVLNLTAESAPARIDQFERVLAQIQPDVIVTQENAASYEATRFFLAVPAEIGHPWGSIYLDGPDTDPACFYNRDYLSLVGGNGYYLATDLRNIAEYHFAVNNTRDSFRLFTCQLTDGDTPADELQRLKEVAVILRRMDTLTRNARRTGSRDTLFVLAGDLNIYKASEPAYVILTSPNGAIPDAPYLYDPIERSGNWNNNAEFADIHTSSSRVRSFGGGATGGMSNRFDQILYSYAMGSRHVRGSYTVYGNDALHFRDSINRLPNAAVADSIAQSLHDASDHLPVYADFIFETVETGVREEPASGITEMPIYPQPASDWIVLPVQWAAAGRMRLRLVNSEGETVLDKVVMIASGDLTLELDVRSLPAGVYGYIAETSAVVGSGKVLIVK